MNPAVRATAEKLLQSPMFSQVGKCESKNVLVVHSWEEAIEHCSKIEYENLLIHAANDVAMRLLETDRDIYERWNEVVEANRPLLNQLMDEKVYPIAAANRLPKVFIDMVGWDLGHLLIEAEYSNILRPGFFIGTSYWYWKGFFPCGWDGIHPAGRGIIF